MKRNPISLVLIIILCIAAYLESQPRGIETWVKDGVAIAIIASDVAREDDGVALVNALDREKWVRGGRRKNPCYQFAILVKPDVASYSVIGRLNGAELHTGNLSDTLAFLGMMRTMCGGPLFHY